MKKFLSFAMAALMLAGMTSCNSNSNTENTENTTSTEETAPDNDTQVTDNKTVGREFLEKNAKNDSVVQTESGLQYMVLKEGTGAKPGPTDEVTVHYTGKLLNGKVFDSSVERGEPATFPLDKVIPGWTEGLQLMSEGSKYRLFIPSELAYGENGAGEDILPNSTLIFDVELIKVNKKNQ